MKAIGVHTFAGGICQGVRKHFDIIKCHEPLKFGVETLRERLGLRVVEEANVSLWRRPATPADFVFGNPRCGGFSGLGSNVAGAGARGHGCRQAEDARQLVEYGCIRVRAPIVVLESVPALYGSMANRPFLDRLMYEVAFPEGYRATHVFHCGASFGNAQRHRRRYFLVLHRKGIAFHVPRVVAPKRQTTVGDVLGPFLDRDVVGTMLNRKYAEYDADTHRQMREDIESCYPYLEQGDTASNLFHRYGPKFFRDTVKSENFYRKAINANSEIPYGVAGAEFSLPRLRWDGPCPTLIGHCSGFVHPTLNRTLTVGELSALMGWEPGLIPAGPNPGAQIAKGIVPACGEFIACAAALSLSGGPIDDDDDGDAADDSVLERVVDVSKQLASGFDVRTWNPIRSEPMYDYNLKKIKELKDYANQDQD